MIHHDSMSPSPSPFTSTNSSACAGWMSAAFSQRATMCVVSQRAELGDVCVETLLKDRDPTIQDVKDVKDVKNA